MSQHTQAQHNQVTGKEVLSAIGQGSPDVITQIDREGSILFWTPGAEQMLEYSESEILGKSIETIIPPEIRDSVMAGIRNQFDKNIPIVHEETIRLSKSGKRVPVLLTRVPIRNNQCEIVALLGILKDITEQKSLHKERKNLKKEQKNLQRQFEILERNTAMGKVAAKVAHEIRTPLGVLFLKSDMLVERLHVAFDEWGTGDFEVHHKRLEKTVNDIQRQISRLEEIANNYLYLSKTRTMERETITAILLITNIIKELHEQYHEGDIIIQEDVQDDTLSLWVDIQQFERVFLNLVRNSVEAIRQSNSKKSNRKTGHIYLRARVSEAGTILEIQDDGPGMPEEIKQAVFDPFTTTKSIGTGLGLYLAKEIVENHGGSIEIDSEEGQGTTVRIQVPHEESQDL